MKTHPIKAEVFNLRGEKVCISKDFNKLDISILVNGEYMINYVDIDGNIIWSERFVKGRKLEKVPSYAQ
jgi:hypothetical protein